MIRAGLLLATLLGGGAALAAGAEPMTANALCGSLTGQRVELLHEVRFLDRSKGWAVRTPAGMRSVLRDTCLERARHAMARHRCGPERGSRVAVLRYAGVLANQRDPDPFSMTALYEIAFTDADGQVVDTPETELVFRGCLSLDSGDRWPEPTVSQL